MDGYEGVVDVVFPKANVVFKGGRVCQWIRYGPVVFGDIDRNEMVLLEEDACQRYR